MFAEGSKDLPPLPVVAPCWPLHANDTIVLVCNNKELLKCVPNLAKVLDSPCNEFASAWTTLLVDMLPATTTRAGNAAP